MNAPQNITPIAAAVQQAAPEPENDFERLLQKSFSPRELLDGDYLDRIYRIAESLANSKLSVPEHLRGNIGDCMAIVTQAMLWNMNPFAVAQKTHIVSGRLGYEAQLVNAVLQNSGAVRGLPHYEYRGEGGALECRVGFVPRGGSAVVWNEFLKSSDITTKNSPLWKTNPKQQLGYLQIKNWARAYCPGAILGVYTTDELEDMPLPAATAASAPAPAPAEPQRPALPAYDPAAFAKNLPQWRGIVESGRKSAEDLLTMLSTKATFSAEQQAKIRALSVPTQAPAPAPAAEAPPPDEFVRDMEAAEGAQQ